MAMVLIIVGGMLLTGAFAFYISQNVDHGEARFGPDGQLPPYRAKEEDKPEMRVNLKGEEKRKD